MHMRVDIVYLPNTSGAMIENGEHGATVEMREDKQLWDDAWGHMNAGDGRRVIASSDDICELLRAWWQCTENGRSTVENDADR